MPEFLFLRYRNNFNQLLMFLHYKIQATILALHLVPEERRGSTNPRIRIRFGQGSYYSPIPQQTPARILSVFERWSRFMKET